MEQQACAFTGHRPQRFSFGYDEDHEKCIRLKLALAQQVNLLIESGVSSFYTGMAQGVDMWAAEIILEFRQINPQLKLSCILPCETQADKWSVQSRERYFNILSEADETIYISRHCTKTCMMERNRYLVDHSQYMIAVYDGTPRGGTAGTVRYARQRGREIILIDPNTSAVTFSLYPQGRQEIKNNVVDLTDFRKNQQHGTLDLH